MITLRAVTEANWEAVFELKPADDQAKFIEHNGLSLLEACYIRGYQPRAIYADEVMVGFLMFFRETNTGNYWVDRLMIGAEHQGKGYGRAALSLIIAELSARPECTALYLSHVEGNHAAAKLYKTLGFAHTGDQDEHGEHIMRLPVAQSDTLRLKRVDADDWRLCYGLRVHPEQHEFVATNRYSLLEAHYEGDLVPLAFYVGGVMVGFGMYSTTWEMEAYWINRLMVDAKQQGKGYGRAGLLAMIDHMRVLPHCTRIGISFKPDNAVARKLYERVGFVCVDTLLDGEVLAYLTVTSLAGG
jgi:diamine N-acetyltransferase